MVVVGISARLVDGSYKVGENLIKKIKENNAFCEFIADGGQLVCSERYYCLWYSKR